MKTKEKIKAGIIALVVIFFLSSMVSCNHEKKVARKLLASTETVLLDSFSRMKIFKAQLGLTPCANDTQFIHGKPVFVKGKDSSYPVYFNISFYRIRAFDTTIKGVNIKIDTFGHVVLKLPLADTIRITDTTITKDKQELKRLMQENINKDMQIAASNQSKIDDQAVIADNKKEKNKWMWSFIAVLAIIVFGIGAKLYLKFKI